MVKSFGCNETCASNHIKVMCGGNACFETKSAKYVCNEDASDDDKYTIVIINQFNNLPFLM